MHAGGWYKVLVLYDRGAKGHRARIFFHFGTPSPASGPRALQYLEWWLRGSSTSHELYKCTIYVSANKMELHVHAVLRQFPRIMLTFDLKIQLALQMRDGMQLEAFVFDDTEQHNH